VALQNLISDDYMAVNFENRVSSKEIEIATAWDAMNVDEIHARVFGASASASGFISAQGKKTDGARFTAKVRFLAVLVKQNGQWQLAATQSSAVKVPQHGPNGDGAASTYFRPVPLFAAESRIANRGFAI
jgi:ketosteroid isomerase-like protein